MHRASSAFPHPSATSVVCGTSGPFCRSSRNISLLCAATLASYCSSVRCGKALAFFPSSPCWTLSWGCAVSNAFLAPLLQLPLSSPTAVLLFYSLLWCMFSSGWWHGNKLELFCPSKCWRRHLISLGHLQIWQCISKSWAWRGFQGCTDLRVVLDRGETGKTTGKYRMLWSQKAQVLSSIQTGRHIVYNAK